jgi:hypothetical protein
VNCVVAPGGEAKPHRPIRTVPRGRVKGEVFCDSRWRCSVSQGFVYFCLLGTPGLESAIWTRLCRTGYQIFGEVGVESDDSSGSG